MMETPEDIRKALFALLRAGLWNRKPDLDCFPLSESGWNRLYNHARKQTVEGLVYDGILHLPDEFLPPQALLLKWVVLIDSLERRNTEMNTAIEELNRWFAHHGITAVLLKGQEVASCYEKPLHRVCGDIDWYIPYQKDYKTLLRMLAREGLTWERQPGFSIGCHWKGFIIEFHRRMLDIHNPFVLSYLWKLQQSQHFQSWVLSHLIVNSHILKHMLSFGIGLRQLCDSARVCHASSALLDRELMEKVYRKVGMHRWVQALNGVLVRELGLAEEDLPFPLSSSVEEANWLVQEVWAGGNFGFFDERFGKQTQPWQKRKHVVRHLLHRFLLHVRYVPSEACWFPPVQFYSRIFVHFNL